MKIKKAIVLVNLDIDEDQKLRQLYLNKEDMEKFIIFLEKGMICDELKVSDKYIETIELEKK